MKDFNLAKKICKEHGVKGFRKLKLKRTLYVAGKQTIQINQHIAFRLLDSLKAAGFKVDQEALMYSLAGKGFLDTVTVR